jgi:hypothetical protein
VKLNPQSETAYSNLDAALLDKGDFKESAAALAVAVALLEKPKATLPGSMQLSRLRGSRGRFPPSHCALPDGPGSSHLLEGRSFTMHDDSDAPLVVIVNQTMAGIGMALLFATVWPEGEDPLASWSGV